MLGITYTMYKNIPVFQFAMQCISFQCVQAMVIANKQENKKEY